MDCIRKNISFLLLMMPVMTFSQFEVKDTACIGEMISITNNSRVAGDYYWTFCSGNLYYPPEGETVPFPGTISEPAFIDFAEDNGEWFSFITNHNDGSITRNYYGTDILSTPVSENMGDFGGIIPQHVQGVQIVFDEPNDNWYVFLVGGQGPDSRLVRLDFGNSLANTPVAENLGNLGGLDTPIDLYIIKEDDNWYGFTVNFGSDQLTRFNFGSDLSISVPATLTFSILLGLNGPTGLFPIQEEGDWYLFVSNYSSHEIIRLDLGNSLNNYPTPTNIGGPGFLAFPFDLTILRDCEGLFGFVLNRFNDIARMEFNQGVDQPPEFVSLGDQEILFNPHGISDVFRVGDTLYTFVANIDNSTITRLFFPGCDNASPASSREQNPPEISYNLPGNYNIQLVLDEGTLQQENYCQNLVVLESPEVELGNDTLLPPGETLVLDAGEHAAWQWSTGETSQTVEISGPGTYTIIVTNEFGCTATDEIIVTMEVGIPNFFTPNSDGVNDTWNIPYLSNNPDARIYIYDRFGNLITTYLYGEGGWDGTRNGQPVKADTYWYVIKISNDIKPLKGSVTLKR